MDDQLKATESLETVYRTWTICGGSRKIIFKSRLCVVNHAAMTCTGKDVKLARS